MMTDLTLPLGFRWSAVKAGIKASGNPDLALAVCDDPASAAACFTSNQVVAAPVTVGRRHLSATADRVSILLVNAGNANCATGSPGIDACNRCCMAAANAFGCGAVDVFPSSTGIIGVPLPTENLIAAIPAAKAALGATPAHAEAFATAILTTDTRLKTAHATIPADDRTVNIFACAKGAGMIGPQLVPHATMLVYIFTDLGATAKELSAYLNPAVEASFNSISIDGDMSTNDTVLLLASGASGVSLSPSVSFAFKSTLTQVCQSLAHQIVDDGEGVTHVVTLDITGTRDDADARIIARAIANSPLCKTAWSSADPNWGRLLAAAGKSGIAFDPTILTIHIGQLPVFAHGTRSPAFDEPAVHAIMSHREYTISLDFGHGPGRSRFITCDLTHEYVSINADYST